jgi:antitoxin (DNA-binding transcriptional repressor) of toxin-antitoxin stability system
MAADTTTHHDDGRYGDVFERADGGETILVARDGRAIAVVVPIPAARAAGLLETASVTGVDPGVPGRPLTAEEIVSGT